MEERILELEAIIEGKDEEKLIEFFEQNQSLELFFLKTKLEDEVEVYTTEPDESEQVPFSSMNLVQIAAALDMSDTVIGYFLRTF